MKGWANAYIATLLRGASVQFRPRGNSMRPRICSGELVTVAPIRGPIQRGDVVLCQVDGKQWLHKVVGIGSDGRYQIGNNRGHINGWTTLEKIYGKVVAVGD